MNTGYTFFNNYHLAAKEYANGDLLVYGRLIYIINMYAIEGELVEDITPAEKLFFTSVKANIDKSLKLAEAGRKGGKKSKKTIDEENNEETETLNNDVFDPKNKAYKPKEKAYSELELEIEDEYIIKNEDIENKNKNVEYVNTYGLYDSLNPLEKKVLHWILSKHIDVTKKNVAYITRIAEYLSCKNYDSENYLNYLYSIVEDNYDFISLGLIFNSISWESTESNYEALLKKQKKEKKVHPDAPKICKVCGSSLIPGALLNSVECPECRKKGNPVWWEYDDNQKRWICNL